MQGPFVTVIKKDGHTVAGILIDITSDDHLFIKGAHKESIFHFSQSLQISQQDQIGWNRNGGD